MLPRRQCGRKEGGLDRLDSADCTAREDSQLVKYPVDHTYLRDTEKPKADPRNNFAPGLAALPGSRQGETKLRGANLDDIAIPQRRSPFDRFVIERYKRVWLNVKDDLLPAPRKHQVPLPNAAIVEPQKGIRRTPHVERKMAGYDARARLFAGEDVKLDHCYQRRCTVIWSFG